MFEETASNTDNTGEPKGNGMKKLMAALTILLLLGVGVRVWLIHRERVEANKPAEAASAPDYTADEMVLPRRLHQMDMGDAKQLNGKPLWVWAAGQLNADPATPTHVDVNKPGPLLLGVDKLQVVNFIEQKVPESLYSRVPKGDAQVFMLFHRADDPAKLWGTAVGYREGKIYTFYIDECFFYDDPHELYKHWGAANWKAIEEHKAIKGMNERMVQLALGQVSKPGPGAVGDRTVVYDNNGHPVTITFTKDRAISID